MYDTMEVEIDCRRSGTIEVELRWRPTTNELSVTVTDLRNMETIVIPVSGEKARHAFNHPYAYAASMGIELSSYGHATGTMESRRG